MLFMVEKGIKGRICYAICRFVKADNKHLKNYDEKQNHHTLSIKTKIAWMDNVTEVTCK